MPGDVCAGVRLDADPNGPVVLIEPSQDLQRPGKVWRGYGVLAVPSSTPRPDVFKTKYRKGTRRSKVSSKVTEQPAGWRVLARVMAEVDPTNPTQARWRAMPEKTTAGVGENLEQLKTAYGAMATNYIDAVYGTHITRTKREIAANRLVSLTLQNHPRDYELALGCDDINDRIQIALNAIGRHFAKDRDLNLVERAMFLPVRPGDKSQIQDWIEAVIEADEDEDTDARRQEKALKLALQLPFGEPTQRPKHDMARAQEILESSHYGQKRVKNKLLRVYQDRLWWDEKIRETGNPHLPPPPLPSPLLIGAYGVGKTTMGRSLAQAMGAEFLEIKAGTMQHGDDLKGSLGVWVGSNAGKIVRGLGKAGTTNLVMYVDEIDKISGPHADQVWASILELADPSQRKNWQDQMLDELNVDLSNVWIVFGANHEENIPASVMDKLMPLPFLSYTSIEKLEMARSHLLPKIRKEQLLSKDEFDVTDDAMRYIIRNYTHEGGVRNFESKLRDMARGVEQLLSNGGTPKPIDVETAKALLDPPDVVYEPPPPTGPPGYCREMVVYGDGNGGGLVGGQFSWLPKISNPDKSDINNGLVGQMSVETNRRVHSYIQMQGPKFWKQRFGVDFPAEYLATHYLQYDGDHWDGLDGPSAGAISTLAAISALTGIPLRGDIVMTGTLTMRGEILKVGGVRDKIVGAYEEGVRDIRIPRECTGFLSHFTPEFLDPAKGGVNVQVCNNLEEAMDIWFSPEIVAQHRAEIQRTAREQKQAVKEIKAMMPHSRPGIFGLG